MLLAQPEDAVGQSAASAWGSVAIPLLARSVMAAIERRNVLILMAIGLFITLVAACMYFYYRCTKAREALFASRRDNAKSQARLQAARKAAQDAEARCSALVHQLNVSMASTGQALEIARTIEVVRRQMAQLLELVAYSDGEHAAEAGQPAVADHGPYQMEPGLTPYGPRQLEPVDVPAHRHVDHTQPMPITHPGQRRSA